MTDHFLDGASVHTLARRYKMKRRDLEAMIEAALVSMRMALRTRGVRGVALRANIDETESAAIITEQGGQENHRERSQDGSSFCNQFA